MEQFVLYLQANYPGSEYFEEDQFQENAKDNLSVIIYFDFSQEKFVVLTDNISYTLNISENTYDNYHTYSKIISDNLPTIYILLARMNGCYEWNYDCIMLHFIYNIYKVSNISNIRDISFHSLLTILTNENKAIAKIEPYMLSKKIFEDEMNILKFHLN